LIFAIIFSLPLFLQHIFHLIPGIDVHFLDSPWLQFTFCTPVFLIGVFRFGKSALNALKLGVFHMDLLIITGSTSAFVYSVIGLIMHDHSMLFFETAAMIITLVLLGNYIEEKTVKQTSSAIEGLKNLQQHTALRLNPKTGQVNKINIEDLKTYDLVMVNQGDSVPSDGIILSGEAYLDESMISGESEAKLKTKGEEVIGATIVISGSLKVQVTRTGTATVLNNMIELVKKAQREKPSIQKLADRISQIFVPAVFSISIITFIISFLFAGIGLTQSILNSIAVLVVSCPCAMGLATPTAIAAGVGRLSKEGIMVKSGQILQNLASVKKILFDKTGTLTEGKVNIVDFQTIDLEINMAKSIFYEMETHSSHPIATAVLKAFHSEKNEFVSIQLKNILEHRSEGISAKDESGNLWQIAGIKSEFSDTKKKIGLYRNGQLTAWAEISDNLRSNAQHALNQLKLQGYEFIIVSGDTTKEVARVAELLNIKTFHGEMKPEQKYKLIESENVEGHVAMIGDGINDAAALNKATVGISFSEASRIAVNSADMVLMRSDLNLLPKAFRISKVTLKTIKQNLFWAFSYNIIAIPLAATGFLSPMVAALLMSFSDLIVVGNSIRLVFRKFN